MIPESIIIKQEPVPEGMPKSIRLSLKTPLTGRAVLYEEITQHGNETIIYREFVKKEKV